MPWNPWDALRSVAKTLWPEPTYLTPELNPPTLGTTHRTDPFNVFGGDPLHEDELTKTNLRIAKMQEMLNQAQAPMPEAEPVPKARFADDPLWGQDTNPSIDDEIQRQQTEAAARHADLEDLQKRLTDASAALDRPTGERPKPVDWQSATAGWNFQPPTAYSALIASQQKPVAPTELYPGPLGGFGEAVREKTHEWLKPSEPIAAQFPQPPVNIPGLAPEGLVNRAARKVQEVIAGIPTPADLAATTAGGLAGLLEQGARLSPQLNPAIYGSPMKLAGATEPGENEVLNAVAQFAKSGFQAATPAIVGSMAISPIAVTRGLLTFGASETIINALARKAGLSQDVSDLIGLAGGGVVAGKLGGIKPGAYDDLAAMLEQREGELAPTRFIRQPAHEGVETPIVPLKPKPPGWTPKSRLAGEPVPAAAPAAAPPAERFVGRPEQGPQPNLQVLSDEDLRVRMMRAVTEGRDDEAATIGDEMDRREASEAVGTPAPTTEPFVQQAPTQARPGAPVQPPLVAATAEARAPYEELDRIIRGVEATLPPEMLGRPAPRVAPTGPVAPPQPPGMVFETPTEPAPGHLQSPLRQVAGEPAQPVAAPAPTTPPPAAPVEPVAAPLEPVAPPAAPTPPPSPVVPAVAERTVNRPIPGTVPRPDLSPLAPAGRRPAEIVEVADPEAIQVDARTYQHKKGDVRGVTGDLSTVREWNPDSPPLMLHALDVTGNDTLKLADGHQRYAKYMELRAQGKVLPPLVAVVKRESQGWTVDRVKRAAALKNMIEPTTNPYDIAKVLRTWPLTPRERDMIARSNFTGRNYTTGEALSTLGEDAFNAAVSNEAIPAEQGALIPKYITDPAQQARAVAELASRNFGTAREAEIFLIELAETPFVQQDMFGNLPEMQQAGVLSTVDQKTNLVNQVGRGLRRRVSAFSNVLKNVDALTKAGNTLAGETNRTIADETRSLLGYFEKYKNAKGTRTRQAINEYSERIARGESTAADAEDGILAALRTDIESGPPPEPVAAAGRPVGGGGVGELPRVEQVPPAPVEPRVEAPRPEPPSQPVPSAQPVAPPQPEPPVQPRPPEVNLEPERAEVRRAVEPVVERAREVTARARRRDFTDLTPEQRTHLGDIRRQYIEAANRAGLQAELERGLFGMDAAAFEAYQRGGFDAVLNVYEKGVARMAQRAEPLPAGREPWVEHERGRYVAPAGKNFVAVEAGEGQATALAPALNAAGFRFRPKWGQWFRDVRNDAQRAEARDAAEQILSRPRAAAAAGPSEVERILGIEPRAAEPATPPPAEAPPPAAPAPLQDILDSRVSGLPPEGERRAVPRGPEQTAEDAAFEAMREKLARGEPVGSAEGRRAFEARQEADKIRAAAEETAAREYGTAPRETPPVGEFNRGDRVSAYGSKGEVLTTGPFGVRVKFTEGRMVQEQGRNGYFDVAPDDIRREVTEAPLEPGRVVKNEFGEEEPMLPGGMDVLSKRLEKSENVYTPEQFKQMYKGHLREMYRLSEKLQDGLHDGTLSREDAADLKAKLHTMRDGLDELDRLSNPKEAQRLYEEANDELRAEQGDLFGPPAAPPSADVKGTNVETPEYTLDDVARVEPAEAKRISDAEAQVTAAERKEPPVSLEEIGRVTPEEAARMNEAERQAKAEEPTTLDLTKPPSELDRVLAKPTSQQLPPNERQFLRQQGGLTDEQIDKMSVEETRAEGQRIGGRLRAEREAKDQARVQARKAELEADAQKRADEIERVRNLPPLEPKVRQYAAMLDKTLTDHRAPGAEVTGLERDYPDFLKDRVAVMDRALKRNRALDGEKVDPETENEILQLKQIAPTDAEAREAVLLKSNLEDMMAKNRAANADRTSKEQQAIDVTAPEAPPMFEQEALARQRAEWLLESTPESLDRYGESLAALQDQDFAVQYKNKFSAEKGEPPRPDLIESPFRRFMREEKGSLDFSALAKLKQENPRKFWMLMNWVAGPLTGGAIGAATDPDDPINGFLRGAVAGRLLTSKGLWDRQARQQWIKYGKAITRLRTDVKPGELPKVRYERNENEDIGFAERFFPVTPEHTVPTIHRAAWSILSELRQAEEYGVETPHGRFDLGPLIAKSEQIVSTPAQKTEAFAARKTLDRIHRAYVGDAVKVIRSMADDAEKAGFINKAAYARNLADYLGRKPTAFQRGIKKAFASAGIDVPYDVVEKTFGRNVYRIGIGWALDSATQNLTQPLLALRFVRARDMLEGYRLANTPEGRAATHHLQIRQPIDVDEAGAPIPSASQMGGPKGFFKDQTRLMATTDNYNRRVVYHAAMTFARDKYGITGKYADDWAQSVVRATQADTGPLSFNPVFRGPIGGSLRPYMKWPGLLVENLLDVMAQPDKMGRTRAILGTTVLILAARKAGIDLEDVLMMGGRPLGIDLTHPTEAARQILTGQTTPIGRMFRDIYAHATGTATHTILPHALTAEEFLQSDLSYLTLGRFPTNVAQTAMRTAHADIEPAMRGEPPTAHMKRTPSGTPNPVSAVEDWLNLTGFKTPRQTEQMRVLQQAGQDVAQGNQAERAKLQDVRRLWIAAMDRGDTEEADRLIGMMKSVASARTMVKGATQTRFDKLLRSASPEVRAALEKEYGAKIRATEIPVR